MTFQNILDFVKDNKEAHSILISTFIGFVALATFVKAIMEFKLQGRQKRAELYNKFDNVFDEEGIKNIVVLLETNINDKNRNLLKSYP